MRRAEVLHLRWCDVERCEDGATVLVREHAEDMLDGVPMLPWKPKTTSGTRAIPIGPDTLATLDAAAVGRPYVFLSPARVRVLAKRFPGIAPPPDRLVNNFTRQWFAILDGAGVERRQFHDLRATVATACSVANVPGHEYENALGHSVEIGRTYQTVTEEARRRFLDAVDF